MRKNFGVIVVLGIGGLLVSASYYLALRSRAVSTSTSAPRSTPATRAAPKAPRADGPGQITLGAARFTIASAHCVRLEYSAHHNFIDERTLFADNRNARFDKAKIVRAPDKVVVNTGKLRLVYRLDGKAFHAGNLKVTFGDNAQLKSWQPGQKNSGHLGGPVPTLDHVDGPINLPPGLISRDGWALVDDSGRAIRRDDWIAPRPGGAPPGEKKIENKTQDFDWYLFAYDNDYSGAMRSLAALSGRAAMPRREVLGSWYCRWHRYTADDFRRIVREYSEHDFPLDILVMDMDWHRQDATAGRSFGGTAGWTGYSWNRELIPQPEKLLQELKSKGVFVALNDHPAEGIRDHEDAYPDFMKRLGEVPAKGYNLPFNAGDKKYMQAFFQSAHAPLEKQGVDFWWVDWQQNGRYPWVPGVEGLRHLPWLNELYFQHSTANGLRGQSYSRWGGWGDHRNPIHFSGDTMASWSVLAFEVPFTAASGNAGCFFWAHDTGGFDGPRNPEMMVRWSQFSALSAALRVHSRGDDADRRPWLWGKTEENAMRRAYHLRSQLLPYIYTAVRQSYDEMLPLVRPMYLAHPDLEAAYHASGQYLLGDDILVAPIVSPGAGPGKVGAQSVWLPPGSWFNYGSGERFEGNREMLATAALDEIPMYVRGGVPIPMQPYTARMGSTPTRQLCVRSYPGEDGKTATTTLYEDDGRTSDYQRGGFARTPLSYARNGNNVTIKIGAVSGRYQGGLSRRAILIELPATTKATRVMLDGKRLTFRYNAQNQTNEILIPSRLVHRSASVIVSCRAADTHTLHSRAVARRWKGMTGVFPASGNVRRALVEMKNISPTQQETLPTVLGVGIIEKMDGPNFADESPRSYFYAPVGVLDGDTVTVFEGGKKARRLNVNGKPISSGESSRGAVVEFRIGGRLFRQKAKSTVSAP